MQPVGQGSCTVTVTTTDGTALTAECQVTVTKPVDEEFGFKFDEDVMDGAGEISIYLGADYTIVPEAREGYVFPDNITWSSSDAAKVSVDDDGTVHGLQLGEAVITATATVNGQTVTAEITVSVIPVPAVSITIDGGNVTSIKRKETLTLTATVLPTNTTYPAVTWESSSTATATVSETGTVTGQQAGNVTITAYVTNQPNVKATYELEITDLLLGDSNDNGIVTVADVVTTAYHIIDKPVAAWSFVNADVNGDNDITSADVTGTVDIILNDIVYTEPQSAKSRIAAASSDRLVAEDFRGDSRELSIGVMLENSMAYSALQAQIKVPERMTVTDVTAGPRAAQHALMYNIKEDGTVKIVIFSYANDSFTEDTNEPLFMIKAVAEADCGDLAIDNIIVSDATSNDYSLGFTGGKNRSLTTYVDGLGAGDATLRLREGGIEILDGEGESLRVFTVGGETIANCVIASQYETLNLVKGIYVVMLGNEAYKIVVK